MVDVDIYDEETEHDLILASIGRGNLANERRTMQRRLAVRCTCGHGGMWHPGGERCMGHIDAEKCSCIEFIPTQDRRK